MAETGTPAADLGGGKRPNPFKGGIKGREGVPGTSRNYFLQVSRTLAGEFAL